MRRQSFGLVAALFVAGVCGGEPPESRTASAQPRVFTGKLIPLAAPGGKPGDRGLALATVGDGAAHPLAEDGASRMLFLDGRLRNRTVRLTALREPGSGTLRVVRVQTVKGGEVYDVDYWCETCQISQMQPGGCVCCGDELELRERPAR